MRDIAVSSASEKIGGIVLKDMFGSVFSDIHNRLSRPKGRYSENYRELKFAIPWNGGQGGS